jgi:hypothetical protein
MKRQTAWRIFAGEFNDSTFEIKGEGEMTPSFIITPLGAKINRLFIIGVLTDVEKLSEDGDLVRAHISDPTGVFTLYSGQYQQDVTDALMHIETPSFVAVIGKARTYSPEEGTIFVSIRPEKIVEVSSDIRDKWILETCKNTKDRIEAILEAMKMEDSNENSLIKLGYSKELSEGIVKALHQYSNVDLNKYVSLIQESLQYLRPKTEKLPYIDTKEESKEQVIKEEKHEKKKAPGKQEQKETQTEEDKKFAEIEKTVLETIKELEGEDGAAWDIITEKCESEGLDKDTIEEALSSLMDKGMIYEPVLGTIKTT